MRMVALTGLFVAGAAAVIVAVIGADDTKDAGSDSEFVRAGVRDCVQRVEGGKLSPQAGRDTLIGPVTFTWLPAAYRSAARDRHRVTPEYLPGLRAHPFKVLVLVAAGQEATLVVPREERAWLRLFYTRRRLGEHQVTLRACRRLASPAARRRECKWQSSFRSACNWTNTQFNGGIYVDFDDAPRLGRCAELLVRWDRGRRQVRRPLFTSGSGACT
jgi:hypothetical protein